MRKNLGKVKVEYHMLDDRVIHKNLYPTRFQDFAQHHEDDFISQTNEEPQGMFILSKIMNMNGEKKFLLTEIDCDLIHWKGNKSGQGPDEVCRKKCRFYNNCPISVHLMMCADLY